MRRAVLAVSALLFVAGCGGDDESDGAAPPASSPQAEQASPQESAGAKTAVEIVDFNFEPGELTVAAGDKVTWTNADSANHNVIFDGDAAENIDNLRQDQKGSVTFDDAGTFKYVCSYHPGMEGTVVVQ